MSRPILPPFAICVWCGGPTGEWRFFPSGVFSFIVVSNSSYDDFHVFFQDSARTKDPPLRHPVTLCVICDYTGGLIFRKVVGGGDFRAARSFFVNIFLVGIFFPYTMVDHLMILSLWCYGLIGQLSPDVIGRLPVLKAKVFLAVKLEWRVSICRCYYQ